MRVVVLADRFGPDRAAAAVAGEVGAGWAESAGHDCVEVYGLSDGGPGFADAIAPIATDSHPVVLTGAFGGDVPADILVRGDTAYVDSSHVIGAHLAPAEATATQALGGSSAGVGELLAAARATGVSRIVLAVGNEVASHDGGHGLLSALGAGHDLADLPTVVQDWTDMRLVLAAASMMPLTGFHGASAALATERGLNAEQSQTFEAMLGAFTEVVDRALGSTPSMDLLSGRPRRREQISGSGTGGGIGYAAQLLGASTQPGAALLLEHLGIRERLRGSLVVLVARRYDWHTVADGVVAESAKAALEAAAPTMVLAQEVLVGRREGMSLGISGTYAPRPGETMQQLGARVARTWSPPPAA